jgi:tight adherence protein C
MTAGARLALTAAWMMTAAWVVLRRSARARGRRRLHAPGAGAEQRSQPQAGTGGELGTTIRRDRRRLLTAVVGVAFVALVAGPALAVGSIAVVAGVPRWRTARRRRQRLDASWASAPDVVTLVRLAVTSGLTPYLAVAEVCELVEAPFGDGFRRVLDDVRDGHRLPDALERLALDLGEPARPLVSALTTSERYGVPLLPSLEAAGVELRRRRRHAAEARARRLPVLLSFPLVCCVLPAFVCLSIAPIAVSALRSLPAPTSTVRSAPSPGSPPAPSPSGGPP